MELILDTAYFYHKP